MIDTPTVSPAEVSVGSPVTISVNVTSGGDLPGTFDVNLIINGTQTDSKSVTLDARASQLVTFTVTEQNPGKYIASINQKHNVTFTVK